ILGRRLVQFALLSQRIAEVVVGSGKVRTQRQRSLILGHRLAQLALLFERVAEVVVSGGVVRLKYQHLLILGYSLVQLTLLCEDITEVDARADEVRLESYGPSVMNSGIFRPSDPVQRQSKVVVKSWHPIVQGERLSDQIYCSVVATDLVGNNSK